MKENHDKHCFDNLKYNFGEVMVIMRAPYHTYENSTKYNDSTYRRP